MDLLNSMTVFVRVVGCENFTTAADQLGISTTMVSNHIRGLEEGSCQDTADSLS
ncbi:hypothetical protein DFLDMN_004868 [Cupriavidus sp. H19C3]|uniref:helix-turn-helix domain-containing protein n=1 Tax=Cupriavidus sp. H19C3 TaxID=3241603 RepID=UPI003BF8E871